MQASLRMWAVFHVMYMPVFLSVVCTPTLHYVSMGHGSVHVPPWYSTIFIFHLHETVVACHSALVALLPSQCPHRWLRQGGTPGKLSPKKSIPSTAVFLLGAESSPDAPNGKAHRATTGIPLSARRRAAIPQATYTPPELVVHSMAFAHRPRAPADTAELGLVLI